MYNDKIQYKVECDRVLLSRRRNSKPGHTFKADDSSISKTSVYATLMALRTIKRNEEEWLFQISDVRPPVIDNEGDYTGP